MGDYFKRYSTLQAAAALRGFQLRASQDDLERHTFIVTRGHVTQELPSLEAVELWLQTQATEVCQ